MANIFPRENCHVLGRMLDRWTSNQPKALFMSGLYRTKAKKNTRPNGRDKFQLLTNDGRIINEQLCFEDKGEHSLTSLPRKEYTQT